MYCLVGNVILSPLNDCNQLIMTCFLCIIKKTSELYFPFYHLLRCGRGIFSLDSEDNKHCLTTNLILAIKSNIFSSCVLPLYW